MKKLILLFGVIFALAGCADDNNSNNAVTETCPISSEDFSYERIAQNQYKMKLSDENKRQFAAGVRWKAINTGNLLGNINTTELEPLLKFNDYQVTNIKEVTFYYNDKQCGNSIVLKPKSTNINCDNMSIAYFQEVFYAEPYSSLYVQFKDNQQLDKTLKYAIKFTEDLTIETNDIRDTSVVFSALYSQIAPLKAPAGAECIFADFIINYPDGSQCIKEIYFNRMN